VLVAIDPQNQQLQPVRNDRRRRGENNLHRRFNIGPGLVISSIKDLKAQLMFNG
jgi:hypothetical protein